MEINKGILKRVEEGMAFAQIAFLLCFGLACVVLYSFSESPFGKEYFSLPAITGLFYIGYFLIFLAVSQLVYNLYTLSRYGEIAFSGKSALERTRREVELLINLKLFGNDNDSAHDSVMDYLKKNPDHIPLFKGLLENISSMNTSSIYNDIKQTETADSDEKKYKNF